MWKAVKRGILWRVGRFQKAQGGRFPVFGRVGLDPLADLSHTRACFLHWRLHAPIFRVMPLIESEVDMNRELPKEGAHAA
jgi:hypothetical protein